MDINDLRRARKQAADDMKTRADALTALEGDAAATDEQITAAETAFHTAQATFEAAQKKVQRAESVEAAEAASAAVPNRDTSGTDTIPPVPAQAMRPEDRGADLGLMVTALAAGKGEIDRACAKLDQWGHSGISAALSGAVDSAGGVTVPRPMANMLVDLLQPRVAVRASGARTVDMPAGELRHARVASGPTATYQPENAPIPESEPTFDKIDMSFKKLTSLVPVGNSLMRHASIAVGGVVRDLMLDAMAQKEDIAFLRYDGSGSLPKGVRNWAPLSNIKLGVGNGVAAVEAALRWAVARVDTANVPMVSPGWIMHPNAIHWLASLRDANSGNYIFPTIEASNTLLGYPIKTTSQLPQNLGAATNESEIYFAAWGHVLIGDSMMLTVATSDQAAYVDVDGDTVSAFQNDLTLMRAISEHDIAPMHDAAIAVIGGAGWGF